ncbi:MAG: calcium/sodium antiporter [Anaerolineae bacterium]
MLEDIFWILIGLAGLFYGGNWLVKGAARFANALGISPIVIGLTIVAFGTSMPEMLVSAQAALRGNADIATGNIVGSNIANIGLILGLAALIYPMTVKLQFLRREIPIMIGVLVLFLFMAQDLIIVRGEGVVLLLGVVAFTVLSYVFAKREGAELAAEIEEFEATKSYRGGKLAGDLGLMAIGILVLVIASDRLVFGAVNIARAVGISELAIGITLVAVGTSLPELATSLIAAFKKESEIAIGNVVGSNIFNVLGILGVTSLITSVNVNPQLVQIEMFIMIGFAIALLVFCLERKLTRWEGAILLTAYAAFIAYSFWVLPPVLPSAAWIR